MCPISVFSEQESTHEQDLMQFAGFHVTLFAQRVHTMSQAICTCIINDRRLTMTGAVHREVQLLCSSLL